MNGINVRIRELRTALGLTQRQFGERVGVKNNTVTVYESGRHVPSESVLELMCREYNVNRSWLESGEGEMFCAADGASKPPDPVDVLMKTYDLEPEMRPIIDTLVRMDKSQQTIVIGLVRDLIGKFSGPPAASAQPTREDLHRELDRQLDEQEKVAGASAASSASA